MSITAIPMGKTFLRLMIVVACSLLQTPGLANQRMPAAQTDTALLYDALDILNTTEAGSFEIATLANIVEAAAALDNQGQVLAILHHGEAVAEALVDPRDQAQALTLLAKRHYQLGDAAKTHQLVSQAMDLLGTVPENTAGYSYLLKYQVNTFNDIATLYQDLGKPAQALVAANRSWQTIEAVATDKRAAAVVATVAATYGSLNETATGLEILAHAVASTDAIEESHRRAEIHSKLSLAYDGLGQPDQAQNILETALMRLDQLPPVIGNSQDKTGYYAYDVYPLDAYGLHHIVQAAAKLQDAERGAAVLKLARIVADSMRFEDSTARAWHSIAVACESLDCAETALNRAMFVANTSDYATARTDLLSDSALVYQQLGQRQQALATLDQALQVAADIDYWPHQIDLLTDIARGYAQLQETDQALAVLQQATKLFEMQAPSTEAWQTQTALATLVRAYGHIEAGEQTLIYLRRLLLELDEMEDEWESISRLHTIVDVAEDIQDRTQALEILEEVQARTQKLEDKGYQSVLWVKIADAMVNLAVPDSIGDPM